LIGGRGGNLLPEGFGVLSSIRLKSILEDGQRMSNHFCNNFGQKLNRIMKTVGFGCAGPTNLWFFCWLRLQTCRPDGAPKNVELLNGLHGLYGMLRVAYCVRETELGKPEKRAMPERKRAKPELWLTFARLCSGLLGFARLLHGKFFLRETRTPRNHGKYVFYRKKAKNPSLSVAFRRFPSLSVAFRRFAAKKLFYEEAKVGSSKCGVGWLVLYRRQVESGRPTVVKSTMAGSGLPHSRTLSRGLCLIQKAQVRLRSASFAFFGGGGYAEGRCEKWIANGRRCIRVQIID
jgi:hypothetical protein